MAVAKGSRKTMLGKKEEEEEGFDPVPFRLEVPSCHCFPRFSCLVPSPQVSSLSSH